MTKNISWDDWRIVNAIATTGTTSRAAEHLGLNQSTVFRRISQLEQLLGVRLFERDKTGFQLTTEGESVWSDIKQLQEITSSIENRVMGLDKRPAGEVKLSVNSTVFRYFLRNSIKEFRQSYPEIKLRLDINDRLVNMKEREADVVIRGSNDPDPDLYGRRITRLSYAIYVGVDWSDPKLEHQAYAMDPSKLTWIGWDGSLLATAPGQWMRKVLGETPTAISSNEVETMAHLAASGHGCALLPRFMGDRHQRLTPISDTVPGLYTELWALTHSELRKTVRVSALLKYVADIIGSHDSLTSSSP